MFEQEDKWVGIEEAADYLGVNKDSIRNWIKKADTVLDSESFPFHSYICDMICWLSWVAASNFACISAISLRTRSTLVRGSVTFAEESIFSSFSCLAHRLFILS